MLVHLLMVETLAIGLADKFRYNVVRPTVEVSIRISISISDSLTAVKAGSKTQEASVKTDNEIANK